MQIIFFKTNHTSPAGRLLGSVRFFFEKVTCALTPLLPANQFMGYVRRFCAVVILLCGNDISRVGQHDLSGFPLGPDTHYPTFWTWSAYL